jgi:Putative phage metallopeptidase
MATYTKADPGVHALVVDLIREHHHDLTEAEVKILVLLAYAPRDKNGEPTGPALTRNNWPTAAKVKINNLADRVAGLPDATILLDGDRWEQWSDERQLATLDAELARLEVRRDESGAVLADDVGRPKLKLSPGDFYVCGHYAIVERYGHDSHEGEAADLLHRELTQREFAWSEPVTA